jgi:hypothetical protein
VLLSIFCWIDVLAWKNERYYILSSMLMPQYRMYILSLFFKKKRELIIID